MNRCDNFSLNGEVRLFFSLSINFLIKQRSLDFIFLRTLRRRFKGKNARKTFKSNLWFNTYLNSTAQIRFQVEIAMNLYNYKNRINGTSDINSPMLKLAFLELTVKKHLKMQMQLDSGAR